MSLDSFPANAISPVSALAFDYGTQRIGVAFGQSLSGTAEAVCILKARDGIPDWDQIAQLIEEWQPDLFVVGMPYNLDGSASALLTRAVKFANRLNGRFQKPSYGMDERLSSREAIEQVLEETGSKSKKHGIDDIAARIILETWFNELAHQTRIDP